MEHLDLPVPVLYALLGKLQDAVFAIEAGKFVYANEQTSQLFGYPESELLACPIVNFIHEQDRAWVMERYAARQRGEAVPDEYEFRIVTQNGDIREVNMQVGVVTEEGGRIISVGSLKDMTDKRKVQRELAHSQADIDSILNNMPDVFYRTDMQGVITMMSPSSFDAIGYTPDEMNGRPMAEFYCDASDRERVVRAITEGGGRAKHVEACMVHKSGEHIWVSTNAHVRLNEQGEPMCVEGIARNISERKTMEEHLARVARLDDLTQLLNRRQFLAEAATQLAITKRYQRPVTVAMLDLDHFKSINDRYGHAVGDRVLIYFSDCCRRQFRSTDIVGRMGGEEFAVLMPESSPDAAYEVLQRLRGELKEHPLETEGNTIFLSFSAGLASVDSENIQELDGLLRMADRLLYQAKGSGRDQVQCHAP